MVIGIDTYHEGKGGKGDSVGAFVASLNAHCTQWYSRVTFKQPRQELMNCLKVCLTGALRKYKEV